MAKELEFNDLGFDEVDAEEIEDSDGGYSWKGVDARGRRLKSMRSYAKTEADAENEINAAGIRISSLKPTTLTRRKRHTPKYQELATLARNFGEQIEAGNTPQEILKMLADGEENETMSNALIGALTALKSGRELHTAFDIQRDHKGNVVFPREFITAIEIGVSIGATPNRETGKKQGSTRKPEAILFSREYQAALNCCARLRE